VEQTIAKTAPDPKALACSGLLRSDSHAVWLRFVDGRPVSHVTTAFLVWLCQRLAAERKRVLRLLWDNAAWPRSREVSTWLRAYHLGHNVGVDAVAFAPTGTLIASGNVDNLLSLRHTQTGKIWQTLTGHSSGVTSVAFSPDNTG
jgi:WD40 repeat protein